MSQQSHIRFIVIRHGETLWNVQQRYQGQLDSPLTANGIAQAQAIARRLEHVRADALLCSNLKRTRDTADAILRYHPQLPVHIDPRLGERHFGILGGLTREEAQARYPQVVASYSSSDADYRPEGGESLNDVSARTEAAFEDWASQFSAGQTVIVVTHGGVLGQFLRYVMAIPAGARRTYEFVNAAYNEFSYTPGSLRSSSVGIAMGQAFPHHGWALHTWGDTSHMQTLGQRDDI